MQIPGNLIETINLVVRTSRRLFAERGREPSPAELAARVGLPLNKVEKALEIAAAAPIGLGSLTAPR